MGANPSRRGDLNDKGGEGLSQEHLTTVQAEGVILSQYKKYPLRTKKSKLSEKAKKLNVCLTHSINFDFNRPILKQNNI